VDGSIDITENNEIGVLSAANEEQHEALALSVDKIKIFVVTLVAQDKVKERKYMPATKMVCNMIPCKHYHYFHPRPYAHPHHGTCLPFS